eukprot:449977_1
MIMLITIIQKANPALTIGLAALSIGLELVVILYNHAYRSGSHVNPSVTLCVMIRNIQAFPLNERKTVMMYFISQYFGGIMSGLLAWLIGGKEAAAIYPYVQLDTSVGYNLFRAWIAEVTFTWFLCATVCYVATDKRSFENPYYGLSIGLSVTVGIVCIAPISGCCLNCAVWLGAVIPAVATDQTAAHGLTDAWIYWTAPFVGAALAGILFNIFDGQESQIKEESRRLIGGNQRSNRGNTEMSSHHSNKNNEFVLNIFIILQQQYIHYNSQLILGHQIIQLNIVNSAIYYKNIYIHWITNASLLHIIFIFI